MESPEERTTSQLTLNPRKATSNNNEPSAEVALICGTSQKSPRKREFISFIPVPKL